MVAVTYGVARAAARSLSASPKAVAADKGKGFFARMMQAMIEARMKQAYRELALYGRLNVDETADQGELPFGR